VTSTRQREKEARPARPARDRGRFADGGELNRAFTLLEVLLAIAIFSIVLVAIHMVFYSAVQLRNKTTAALESSIPLQQALTLMKRDLQNIVMPGGTFFGELQTSQASTLGTTNLLNTMSPVNDSLPGQSSPAFFTASGVLDDTLPWGAIERVTYYLAPSTNNTPGKDLIRSVTRNLLPSMPEIPETQPLMSGLEGIFFTYYDGIQWRDYWDSTIESNKLPQGIKVELQLVNEPGSRYRPMPIDLVVPVVLQPPTNQTSQASL
jgi:type II secretion system protein J